MIFAIQLGLYDVVFNPFPDSGLNMRLLMSLLNPDIQPVLSHPIVTSQSCSGLLLVPQAMPWRAPILISQINFQTG
jgi:hypothetical protein